MAAKRKAKAKSKPKAPAGPAPFAVGDQVQTEEGAGFIESIEGDTHHVRLYRPKGRRDMRALKAGELTRA